MNLPEKHTPEPVGPRADVEALLKELPVAYAEWERAAVSPDLERIRDRVVELLRDPDRP